MSKYGLENVDYKIDSSGNYTCLLDTSKTSLLTLLENKYPSIVLFSGLATWGGSDDDFELNEMNFARYGKHCVTLANKDVTWNKEHATLISQMCIRDSSCVNSSSVVAGVKPSFCNTSKRYANAVKDLSLIHIYTTILTKRMTKIWCSDKTCDKMTILFCKKSL